VPPTATPNPPATPAAPTTAAPTAAPATPTAAAPKGGRAAAAKPAGCLTSGNGYLRAHLAGAIEANVDWPNSGTRCEGESRDSPPGVRLSFRRVHGDKTDLLFVFGITGVREGKPAHEAGTNLTVIVQGANRIFGTMGDSRCTVDSLTQQPLDQPGAYRVEARGFCTQPAHAVLGAGAVLVSTFEFAGPVTYDAHND
jgi:nucleoid-associated protein YgaU